MRPRIAIIDVMPSFVAREREDFLAHHLNLTELREVTIYVRSARLGWYALRHRYVKPDQLKRAIFGPELVPAGHPGGPTYLVESITPEDRANRIATQRSFHDRTISKISLASGGERARWRLIETCRACGVIPVMVLSPEGPVFQSYYGPESWARFLTDLERRAAETGVRLINARNWLTEDQFYDSHHPLKQIWSRRSSHLEHSPTENRL